MRLAVRDARLIDAVRRRSARQRAVHGPADQPQRSRSGAALAQRSGVFGRFVPDFGRVNAQMQFDMYHHYTVDEHTIRAIGLLARIEKGELAADHPLASQSSTR
jgi:[protein-PII] uridylyltransferase